MRRTGLIGLAVAGAVALAACGSNSAGTPTAATTVASTAATSSAAGGAATSSESMTSSESATSGDSASAGATDQSSAGSVDTASSADTESSASEATTTTLHGTLDGATTDWFTSFCTNLGPAMTTMTGMGTAMTGDPKKGQTAIADAFDKVGDAFSKTAADLSALPPPTIEHGTEIAAKIIDAMGKAGPAYKSAAEKVRSATVATSQDLEKAVSDAGQDAESSLGDFNIGNYDLDPALQTQIKQIPACKSFMN
jgi:hypothetical protein